MGFRTKKKSSKEAVQDIKKKYTPEQINRAKVLKVAFNELFEEAPDDVYYSLEFIKQTLLAFFVADSNLDGNVELNELLKNMDSILKCMGIESEEGKKNCADSLRWSFDNSDVSGDKKVSLAEWLIIGTFTLDRINDYKVWAYRFDEEDEKESEPSE